MNQAVEDDLTQTAERQIQALRRRHQTAAVRFLAELMGGGCAQAGYRLVGDDVLDSLCCRHLYGSDRAITAWPAPDEAVAIAVGPHDQSADDIYELLLATLQINTPKGERLKTQCCGDLDEPPVDPEAAEKIASAISALDRRDRRR